MPSVTHWREHGFGGAVGAAHHHAADVRRRIRPISSNVRLRSFQSSMLSGATRLAATSSRALPEHDEPLGLAERQRAEQRRVDQREDRAVGADAERERHRRDGGERRRAAQLPRREPHVVPELVDPSRQAHVRSPTYDFDARHSTKVAMDSRVDCSRLNSVRPELK